MVNQAFRLFLKSRECGQINIFGSIFIIGNFMDYSHLSIREKFSSLDKKFALYFTDQFHEICLTTHSHHM